MPLRDREETMKTIQAVRLAGVAAVLLAIHPGVWAQNKTTSAITGIVRGQDGGAVVGASVTIESPQLIGGARTQATDA
jgi:hypothetical protein